MAPLLLVVAVNTTQRLSPSLCPRTRLQQSTSLAQLIKQEESACLRSAQHRYVGLVRVMVNGKLRCILQVRNSTGSN